MPVEEGAVRLPAALEELRPGAEQREALLALASELAARVAPLVDAGRDFGHAVALAAARCKGDSMGLDSEASFAVTMGEQTREGVLDAIDRLHRILTHRQRKALASRLLGDEKASREKKRGDARARDLGDELDLSIGQMLRLLVRAGALRDAFEERIEPWRDRLREALEAFPSDDFAIRDQPIAKAPVVAVATQLVRDAMRVLLPVLEPEQCKVLGSFIDDMIAAEPAPTTPDGSAAAPALEPPQSSR